MRLVTYVHVGGVVYGPGRDVPADVAKRITNPDVWAHEVQTPAAPPAPEAPPAKPAAKRPARATKPKE